MSQKPGESRRLAIPRGKSRKTGWKLTGASVLLYHPSYEIIQVGSCAEAQNKCVIKQGIRNSKIAFELFFERTYKIIDLCL